MYSLYIALSFCSTHPQSLIHLSFSHLETSAQEGIFHRHLIFLKDQLPNLHKELLLGGRGVVEGNSCFALLASSFHQLVLASSFFLPTGAASGFELLSTNWWWLETNFATLQLSPTTLTTICLVYVVNALTYVYCTVTVVLFMGAHPYTHKLR